MTLLANDERLRVAKPRSPILTEPVGPVMKMLSHLRSRWMMGGALVWRKCRPFKICRHQLRNTFIFITLKRFRYLMNKELRMITMLFFTRPWQSKNKQQMYQCMMIQVSRFGDHVLDFNQWNENQWENSLLNSSIRSHFSLYEDQGELNDCMMMGLGICSIHMDTVAFSSISPR